MARYLPVRSTPSADAVRLPFWRVEKRSPLVGRAVERAALGAALMRCRLSEGGLVLVHGDAGVGKSRLVSEVLEDWEGCVLRGAAGVGGGAYAPVVEVLRRVSDAFGDVALAEPARVLLPELAMPWREVDHRALVAAIHRTLRDVARRHPTVVVLEDLHWANAATIELLPMLDASLSRERLVIVGTYRTEELPRSHPLRAMRSELRRDGRLVEVALRPLAPAETGEMLAGLFGVPPSPDLVLAVHERAEGLPFFIEELAAALLETSALATRERLVELASGTELPLPESVLDAVLVATARLRRDHQVAVELAAVIGVRIDLPSFGDLVSAEDIDALLDAGLLMEDSSDSAVFRHALVRDALYRAIPWARRRGHHRLVAEHLAMRRSAPEVVAEHWIAGHEPARARPLLLAAADQFCALHAYRDAAALGRRALSIWPDGEGESERMGVLERLADCAELCGELDEAARVWAELAGLHRSRDEHVLAGLALRRLANAAGMLGDWPRAVAAREAGAEAFVLGGDRVEAAVERLALAEQLESASLPTRALEHAVAATEDAVVTDRVDLQVHALGLQGTIRAALGDVRGGIELARSALELALAEELTVSAAVSYYELASALIYAADYAGSAEAWSSGVGLCRAHDLADLGKGCLACMSVAVRFLGDWDRAATIASEVLEDDLGPDVVRMVAQEELGLIAALRGDRRRARGPLRRAAAFGRNHGVFGIEVGATWGLAVVADLDGDETDARSTVSTMLERCASKELSHFALPALRWAATFLAVGGEREGLARCHRHLATAATQNSSAKVLSALAHAGGETALSEGEPAQAAAQFDRSVQLLQGITSPFEQALAQLRWGAALARAGERKEAIATVTSAYRTARQLGAKPLARDCVTELAQMGEQVDRRLGRLAARALEPAGLTRREQEVLGLVAAGHTNAQIARELFVSPRTVDMHVRNVLSKLGCTTRVAAARRAAELRLVEIPGAPAGAST